MEHQQYDKMLAEMKLYVDQAAGRIAGKLDAVTEQAAAAAEVAYKASSDSLKAHQEFRRDINQLSETVRPMAEAWGSVSGFNRISVWLLKLLLGFGAAIGALYAVVEFLKRVGRISE